MNVGLVICDGGYAPLCTTERRRDAEGDQVGKRIVLDPELAGRTSSPCHLAVQTITDQRSKYADGSSPVITANTGNHPVESGKKAPGSEEVRQDVDLELRLGGQEAIDGADMARGLGAGDVVKVGKTVELEVMDTPGHTMCHICLRSHTDQPALFSGDTLFNAGAGNCHNGGNVGDLYTTFVEQLAKLPEKLNEDPSVKVAKRKMAEIEKLIARKVELKSGGSIVIEQIFAIPGLGRYLVVGAVNRDYTLVMGMVVFYATLILALNLLVDLAYGWLDPRIRHD